MPETAIRWNAGTLERGNAETLERWNAPGPTAPGEKAYFALLSAALR